MVNNFVLIAAAISVTAFVSASRLEAETPFGWQDCTDADLGEALLENWGDASGIGSSTGPEDLSSMELRSLTSGKTWCFPNNEVLESAMICPTGNMIVSENNGSQSRLGFLITEDGKFCLGNSTYQRCYSILSDEDQFVFEPPILLQPLTLSPLDRASPGTLVIEGFTVLDGIERGGWPKACIGLEMAS